MAVAAPAAGVAAAAEIAVAALEAATLGALLTYLVLKGIQIGYNRSIGALLTVLAAGMRAVRIHRRWLHVDPVKGLANKVDDLNHAIHNDLGRAAAAAENAAIYTFHAAGALQAWTTAEIAALSDDFLRALEAVYNHTLPALERDIHDWVNHRLHGIDRLTHGLRAWVEVMITRRIHGLDKLFQHRLNVFGRGIDRTITRVRTDFSKSIARDRAEIAKVRGITVAQARRLAALERWVKAHSGEAGAAAATVALTVGLRKLGLNWLRCSKVNRIGRLLCGADTSLIEALLGSAFTAWAVSDLCSFSAAVEAAAHGARPLLLAAVDAEQALVGCHGATAPRPLALGGYTPTPVYAAGITFTGLSTLDYGASFDTFALDASEPLALEAAPESGQVDPFGLDGGGTATLTEPDASGPIDPFRLEGF